MKTHTDEIAEQATADLFDLWVQSIEGINDVCDRRDRELARIQLEQLELERAARARSAEAQLAFAKAMLDMADCDL